MEPRRSIETTGESIQEAIDKGLAELSAAPHEVIVEVLEEPSRGVFGIGAHPAKVRLQLLITRPVAPPTPPTPPPAPARSAPATQQQQPKRNRDDDRDRGPRQQRPPRQQRNEPSH